MAEIELAYLQDFLSDEFRLDAGVSLKPHRRRPWGVYVRTGSREYFFPVEWVAGENRERLRFEVEKVRSGLAMLSYSNRGVLEDGSPDPYQEY